MDGNTPITLAAGYSDRDGAVADFKSMWRPQGGRLRPHGRRGAHQGRLGPPVKGRLGPSVRRTTGSAIPGKGWFVILRLRSPLRSFFDKTWRSSEIQPA